MTQALIPKIIRRIRKEFSEYRGMLHIDTGDYRQTVILAGTGRSGTTWLQELLNFQNDFRIMFEPFNSKKVQLVRNWNYRQYLSSNDQRTEYIVPAGRILTGKVRHKWIDRYNRKIFPQKRIIKDIRIQLILDWINNQFPEIPIILIMRHPCAVAYSKLKLGWDTHLDDLLEQPQLIRDHLGSFRNALENAQSDFERHIYLWCVENYIPLKQFKENEILVVFYEHLCRNPQHEIKRIMQFIGKGFPEEILDQVHKPSAQSRKDSAIISGVDSVSSWREKVSNEQIQRAVEILRMFGLHQVYNESDMPLLEGTNTLNLISK